MINCAYPLINFYKLVVVLDVSILHFFSPLKEVINVEIPMKLVIMAKLVFGVHYHCGDDG